MEPTPNLAKPSEQNPLDSGSAIGTCRARAYVKVFLSFAFFFAFVFVQESRVREGTVTTVRALQ
jgi:hypothetical protein